MPSLFMNRRKFAGSLLAFYAFVACKKTPALKPQETAFTDPLATNPNFDLGVFNRTELGSELYLPVDISKIFHGYTDKISDKPGETVSLYLSGPPNSNQVIGLSDINGSNVLSVTTPVDFQTIDSDSVSKPWVDGFKYSQTTSVKLPDDLKSGFYRFPGDIPIICKSNSTTADITVVLPSN